MKITIGSHVVLFTFLSLAVVKPTTEAVVPAPDGGYPRGNTAEGQNALFSLTTGGYNTAIGLLSLRSDTTGSFNTGVGAGALLANTGDENTAVGVGALLSNTTGTFNTGNGVFALFNNTGGEFNTGIGSFVLFNNATGSQNMAMGDSALVSNTTGSQNVAIGVSALRNNNADNNVAIGQDALVHNDTGTFNVGIGHSALHENHSGSHNTAVGSFAGFNITGASNICIGDDIEGVPGESNTIRIGDNLPTQTGQSACYIGGIHGQDVAPNTLMTMYVDVTGKVGTMASSQRFKADVKPMEKASDAILSLKPVTFHYKNDTKKTLCYGLIAEQVAEVNPDLVIRDKNGELLSVRYEQVNAMLLNEFLKEHKAFVEEQHKVDRLEATVATLTATVKEQAGQIQKVKAQIELTGSAPKIVGNSQ